MPAQAARWFFKTDRTTQSIFLALKKIVLLNAGFFKDVNWVFDFVAVQAYKNIF
jgi:hypothetical protein